jgi:hypothetical protein
VDGGGKDFVEEMSCKGDEIVGEDEEAEEDLKHGTSFCVSGVILGVGRRHVRRVPRSCDESMNVEVEVGVL